MQTPDRLDKLSWNDVKPAMLKWAKYYSRLFPKFEFWDLINAVWAKGYIQQLIEVRLASARIQWDMLTYIRASDKKTPRNNEADTFLSNIGIDAIDAEESLWRIFNESNLSGNQWQVITHRHFEHLTLVSTGEKMGITKQRVSQIEHSALQSLNKTAKRLDILD